MTWRPSVGAWLDPEGVHFRVWAPESRAVEVVIEGRAPEARVALESSDDGYHTAHVPGLEAGTRYRYSLDGGDPLPDPASRFQPEGVHGPSEVVEPSYAWTDADWRGLDLETLVTYEVHVGTFTPGGTFASAAEALPHLASLGVSAVQLMPVADFAGERNWGYDGVDVFAPARCYGRPDDLRALVDRAHRLGLGVILDVVYNHFGPDGAYQGAYTPRYFTERHHTPWGAAINLDGPGSEAVRAFFIESALHWMHEYHIDGFRLDATDALVDDSDRHFLAEYAERLRAEALPGVRPPVLIAEDHRNLANVVRPQAAVGYGFDAVFADDFHHEMRSILAGDDEGYFQDYAGSTADLARTLEQGWLYTGQHSRYLDAPRGTDPTGLPLPRFLHCLQNHDQVGNRAFGDRLYHEASQPSFAAATTVLLCSAATPLLFMGDEWAARSPFQYFTDHKPDLGRAVTEGRRNEFRAWSAFQDPEMRERIPDPQAVETFERSRLDWSEREREPHASMVRLYRALLRLRREEPALRGGEGARQRAGAPDNDNIALRREHETDEGSTTLLVIARLRRAGPIGAGAEELRAPPEGHRWQAVLTTEDGGLAQEPLAVEIGLDDHAAWCQFRRPGAVVLRAVPIER